MTLRRRTAKAAEAESESEHGSTTSAPKFYPDRKNSFLPRTSKLPSFPGVPSSTHAPKQWYTSSTIVALTILSLWAAFYINALSLNVWETPVWKTVGYVLILEFLYTGMFITTHDAMHGLVSKVKFINDAIGTICISLFAWFDYGKLLKAHWAHHMFTGKVNQDPDFHSGNSKVGAWYFHFMFHYMTFTQLFKIHCYCNALYFVFGVPWENIILFQALAPIMSSFRLFYFGTYLPHRPIKSNGESDWTMSRSTTHPTWLSFWECYHFGKHYEHHRFPFVPWFLLPKYYETVSKVRQDINEN